jgi:hypothetical protein
MIKMLILRNERKMSLINFTSESVELGILLAIVGGFLDAYTFVEEAVFSPMPRQEMSCLWA